MGLAVPKLSRLPKATLGEELVSSGLGKWQDAVNASVWQLSDP